MNLFKPEKYVKMTLVGIDGNAFVILGAFMNEAKRQGWSDADIEKVLNKAKSSNYDNLINTIVSHTN